MKNFLIDTLTIVELARTSFNESVILAEQLEILQGEYEELQGEYQWLEEHCGELQPGGEEGETNLTFQTSVEVDMDMVYVLYQHFFGYPEDGVWDEEKANMIRTHLENREITTFKEDDNVIKIRYNDDPIKIELQSAPSIVLEIKSGHPTSIGDDIIITNILEIKGMDEINYGLKISLILSTLLILAYFVYPSSLIEFISNINLI